MSKTSRSNRPGRPEGTTKPNNRKPVSIRLPSDKLDAIRARAKTTGKKVTDIIEQAIDALLASGG